MVLKVTSDEGRRKKELGSLEVGPPKQTIWPLSLDNRKCPGPDLHLCPAAQRPEMSEMLQDSGSSAHFFFLLLHNNRNDHSCLGGMHEEVAKSLPRNQDGEGPKYFMRGKTILTISASSHSPTPYRLISPSGCLGNSLVLDLSSCFLSLKLLQ